MYVDDVGDMAFFCFWICILIDILYHSTWIRYSYFDSSIRVPSLPPTARCLPILSVYTIRLASHGGLFFKSTLGAARPDRLVH
jgi:hypothetical protein